jgi:3D-(3,5/4)-trihydroxycyclohexane-1,2-dione acylhydrolase (decyclizing)
MDGKPIPIDFVANAASLGAHAVRAANVKELEKAMETARGLDRTSVIVVDTEKEVRVPGYESWWDVPVAEVSEMDTVRAARAKYQTAVKGERYFVSAATE